MGGHHGRSHCCPKKHCCTSEVCKRAPGCSTALLAKYSVDRLNKIFSCLEGKHNTVWRKKRHSTPTSKSHPNCKVWWREHPGQLAIIDRKMNSQVYQDILQEKVRLSVRQLKLNRSWVI
jgi:hypothetical protein